MDELDQLLQELSAPKPIEKPPVERVAAPQMLVVQEVPAPKAVSFDELDGLMAELNGAGSGGSSRPASTSVASVRSVPSPSVAVAMAAPEPVVAPAPVAAAVVAPKKSTAAADLDSLMADLSSSVGSAQSQASKPKDATFAVDALLSELQNSTAPTPSSQPSTKSNAAADLDSVMNSLQSMQPATAQPQSLSVPVAGGGARKGDLDSILNSLSSEMSQVDSDFKGQCALCKKPIMGQVITALGKTWHVEHFACLQCRKPLGSNSFFERDGNPFCEKCFHDAFAPKCAYCDGPIRDKCINALGKTWHPDHFFCSQCGKHFAGGGFMEKDGKAYCEEDYFNMFAPKCGGCEKPIMADCITALGRQWHPNCFVCMECHQGFGGGMFFDFESKPYCEKHYHSQRGSLCASCQKPVVGRCITALGKRFHPEHFVCAFCMKQLNQGTFKENSGKPYCMGCHVKLFG